MSTQVVINSTSKTASKKEIARQLYKDFHSLDRQLLIHKFVEELHISENSARTHISWCAKELNSTLNKPYITRKIDQNKLKKEKAYRIFKSNPNLSRRDIIKLFESNLNMSENSAATHCSLSSKRYVDENGVTAATNHKAVTG
jgi:hypothetical protein